MLRLRKRIFFSFLAVFVLYGLFFSEETTGAAARRDSGIEKRIEKADMETAKMIDELLRKRKPIRLRVKGGKNASQKLMIALTEKIQKTNRQGVIFQYRVKKEKVGNSTVYEISKENARLYDYSVKFVKKLHEKLKNKYREEEEEVYDPAAKKFTPVKVFENRFKDYELYKDAKKVKLRILYDNFVKKAIEHMKSNNHESYFFTDSDGATNIAEYKLSFTGMTDSPLVGEYPFYGGGAEAVKLLYVSATDSEVQSETGVIFHKPTGQEYTYINHFINREIRLKTFEEFVDTVKDPDSLFNKYGIKTIDDRDYEILTRDFADMSDAMKLYVIDKSGYFNSNFGKTDFGMTYTYTSVYHRGAKGMKTLLDNKATGVCMCFAMYEKQLFDQLGIEAFYREKDEIDHAFTVVKAENSKGKVLWVPFDYGIGPAEELVVEEEIKKKYLATEEMRYRLYLGGIKGAPKEKNFVDEDFN